jgi:hypothetical protein
MRKSWNCGDERSRIASKHSGSGGVEVAMKAGEASFELGERAAKQGRRAPSPFDAIVLGTPRVYDSKVLTGDEYFEELPETIAI